MSEVPLPFTVKKVRVHPVYQNSVNYLVEGSCPYCQHVSTLSISHTLLVTSSHHCSKCQKEFVFELPIEFLENTPPLPSDCLDYEKGLFTEVHTQQDEDFYQLGFGFTNSVFTYLASCIFEGESHE